VHAIDGTVNYALEWNGLKFVFGSDTYSNKWLAPVRTWFGSDTASAIGFLDLRRGSVGRLAQGSE